MNTRKKMLLGFWLLLVASALYVVTFHRPFLLGLLENFLRGPHIVSYSILFVLGALRGFTMIPVTLLIFAGILFIPPLPLFLIIMSGVIISSLSVFYFFEYLRLETLFNAKHKKLLDKGHLYLSRYELPVITLWSMAPMLPTDVMCYLAGTLKVNVYKFILGVTVGEGIVCALYIWGGKAALQLL